MTSIFSPDWMMKFQDAWNNEPELAGELAKIGFNSVIGYGFDGEDEPTGVLKIENGQAIESGTYEGQELKWDLRSSRDNWQKWLSNPPGMMALGMAYTTGKLKFKLGDYSTMLKDPRMAGPFIKSFAVMGKV